MFCKKELMQYFNKARKFSATKKGVTRLFCSQEHKEFIPQLIIWMEEAGLNTHLDALGNVVGLKKGTKTNKYLIIGSHQDTVIQGGAYDGILGVLLPLYVLKKMYDNNIELDYGIKLVAFGDEEGIRFPKTLLGAKALCGNVSKQDFNIKDKDGISLYEALKSIGSNPDEFKQCICDKSKTLGFFEVHIEQGPILEKKNLSVGVVTNITGIQRYRVFIQGKANHAGTTPMDMRQDALLAASETVLFANKLFYETDNLVGVVGELNVLPNAVNVIPDSVDMTIEIRSYNQDLINSTAAQITNKFEYLEQKYNVKISINKNYEMQGVPCAEDMQDALANSIKKELNQEAFRLFSGAGHDGLAMSKLTDIAMLFIRCKDGLSHHYLEDIDSNDAKIAADIIYRFLLDFNYKEK